MAGNIPPLVSSTPPPLNEFDDEEEEEEDDFGLYNTAEEIDYNECISFEEKDKEKQNASKSRGEQDSTSQDSATDSGLCPDSEGMSPTPHSDDERTLKQNSCDKLCPNSSELSECQGNTSVNLAADPCPKLPNGHSEQYRGEHESDDNFGNFEFASSLIEHTQPEESVVEGALRSLSPSAIQQYTEIEHNTGLNLNNQICNKQLPVEVECSETFLPAFKRLESSVNGSVFENENCTLSKVDSCIYVQSNSQLHEFSEEMVDVYNSNRSSINSVDLNLVPADPMSSLFEGNEQYNNICCMEETPKEVNSGCQTPNIKAINNSEEGEHDIEIVDEDDFDDFTDFKAGFPEDRNDLSKSEQSVQSLEHSKPFTNEIGKEAALPQEDTDDEFSNFADFSSSDCVFVSAQNSNSSENVLQCPLKLENDDTRTESVFQDWISVFPCDEETCLVAEGLLRQDDVVWSRLFPLESSPAICYQWNESLANRRLLTALNIDARNILLTPWSLTAVPRFAANLSCGPLEPIKASEPQITPPLSSSITTTAIATATATATTTVTITSTTVTTQESVPDAHFDWVSSGLTNPLDCLKTGLNLPKTPSAEAETLLTSLPDILFMRKTYIDFPISKV